MTDMKSYCLNELIYSRIRAYMAKCNEIKPYQATYDYK